MTKTIVLSVEMIGVLARAAGVGANLDQMAALADVSPATLDEIIKRQAGVRQAIEKGRADAHSQVMRSLFNQAVSEKNVAATIFYLKTRCRWREADRGNEDGHTDRGARKSVRLNYSLDDEETHGEAKQEQGEMHDEESQGAAKGAHRKTGA